MKRFVYIIVALSLFASTAFAQEAAQSAATETIRGTLVDNACADANKADIANFVKTHTKDCAVMPACAATGYSIVAGGQLMKFDAASSAKVEEFLKDPNSKLDVTVEAQKTGEALSLVSIKNQE